MIVFEVPSLPPLNTNHRRAHWSKQHKEAERWKMLVWAAMGGKVPKKPYSRVRLVLTRLSSTEPDYDNLVSSFKPVVDALKKLRVIEDDAPKHFAGGHPDYLWKKGKSGIRVEMTPQGGA